MPAALWRRTHGAALRDALACVPPAARAAAPPPPLTPPGTGCCQAPAEGSRGTARCGPGSGTPKSAGCGRCAQGKRDGAGVSGPGVRPGAKALLQHRLDSERAWRHTPKVLVHGVGGPPGAGIHVCLAVGIGDAQEHLHRQPRGASDGALPATRAPRAPGITARTCRCTSGPSMAAVSGGSPPRSCPMLRISRHSTCGKRGRKAQPGGCPTSQHAALHHTGPPAPVGWSSAAGAASPTRR